MAVHMETWHGRPNHWSHIFETGFRKSFLKPLAIWNMPYPILPIPPTHSIGEDPARPKASTPKNKPPKATGTD